MTILHSWCCWRSVRKGSFACGIYAAIYFTGTAAFSSIILHLELEGLKNCTPPNNCTTFPPTVSNATRSGSSSSSISSHQAFLDPDTTSQSSMIFTIITLSAASFGILATCLLLYGLYRDCKILLIPWIMSMVFFIIQDCVYVCHQFVKHAIVFNPSVAILITIDLFINGLNTYALLCVISQYQELKAGRGRAVDDHNNRVPNIHYSSQPTATSYLSTRRAVTYHETRPTPTQSPTGTAPHTSLGTDEPSPSLFNKGPRKSVKFDHSSPSNNGPLPQLLEPWSIDSKSPMMMARTGGDTAPLIEATSGGGGDTVLLQSNL